MPEVNKPITGPRATSHGRIGLAWRLAFTLAAAAAAGLGVERLLMGSVDALAARAGVALAAAVLLAGLSTWILVIGPLTRSREELQARYAAALADSLTDPLTGLGNHRAFQEELDRQVESAQRYGAPLALVILDLDEFKLVNDRNGHADGDRTLAGFGRIMADSIRRVDRSFRIGGDEFAILLPHTDAHNARVVVRRLLAETLQPSTGADGGAPLISFSAGISSMPDRASSRAQLYAQADAAMYQAKHAGRTDVVVFDPASEAETTPVGAGPAVADVIARGLLRPVYQPIFELASGELLGVEGLIRPVPPAPFADPGSLFRAAAASGHTVELDLTCFETIAAGASRLAEGPFVSINLSPTTIEAPDFGVRALVGILARNGIAPERVVLELTEHDEITDLDRVRSRLEACRSAGMRLAADDVGAGNSGLRLLSQFRFDIIKVDLELVRRSASNGAAGPASSAVIESVVALAKRTGALVIGEGIEEAAQLAQLVSLGVVAGQGYLLGRPEPLAPEHVPPSTLLGGIPFSVAPSSPSELDPDSPLNAWRQTIGLPTG